MKRYLHSFAIFLLALFFTNFAHAQLKKQLTVDDIVKWNRISDKKISDDGRYVFVLTEPWKGTSSANLLDNRGNFLFSADSVRSADFTSGGEFLILNRAGKKAESLILFSIKNGTKEIIDSISKFSIMKDWGPWLLFTKKDSTLISLNLANNNRAEFGKVKEWTPAEKSTIILAVQGDSIVVINPSANTKIVAGSAKNIKRLALSKDGDYFAWLSKGEITIQSQSGVIKKISSGESSLPQGWRVPDNSQLYFSESGAKLYFGTAPAERKRDSSAVKGEWPGVQVWNWKEGTQFTAQVVEKEREKKRTFLAVYDIKSSSLVQLSTPSNERVVTSDKGDGEWALSLSDNKYRLEEMWTGRSKYDVHIINTVSDRSVPVAREVNGNPMISPKGNWVIWYSFPDSSWYAWSVKSMTGQFITTPSLLPVHDEDNDVPDWPSAYGVAGWNEDESALYLYDKYDIWRVDPLSLGKPLRITENGRESGITYRVEKTESTRDFIDEKGDLILSVFDNKTKESGYSKIAPGFKKGPQLLVKGPFSFSGLLKAKNSKDIIYTRENYETSPDVYLTDISFKKEQKITNINPQQNDFLWGRAELVSWTSLDGIKLEGVVYKPADFDPNKKYPLIVNFYEKNSSSLYSYRTPEAHRSTVDYHMYNSHGYVVFNPDIVYRDGYPGESGFNCIMPGISSLVQQGWVEEKAIGAQGHSWGGYQVAYLATRTSIFAAIESGAPVVNMFSAYGGIRWGTGLNRSFQYEHQQSRIGATPWEAHQRYIENSPLFAMDKVTTPILIMHNDQDGHVPWYQGIEYFVALKRLQKPVWLLNYSGEVHWPQKIQNKMDFQIRMLQFFDHYLRGKDAPKWMKDGISAIDLDYELGY